MRHLLTLFFFSTHSLSIILVHWGGTRVTLFSSSVCVSVCVCFMSFFVPDAEVNLFFLSLNKPSLDMWKNAFCTIEMNGNEKSEKKKTIKSKSWQYIINTLSQSNNPLFNLIYFFSLNSNGMIKSSIKSPIQPFRFSWNEIYVWRSLFFVTWPCLFTTIFFSQNPMLIILALSVLAWN